jgi:tetratricopeptide (TPR) repeat protein
MIAVSAFAQSGTGSGDQDIARYTQALRLDQNHAEAYNNRDEAYATKRACDRAIADYTQALRLNAE